MKRVVEPLTDVLGNELDILLRRRHEVDRSDVLDRLALRTDHHVQRDAVLPEIAHIKQRRDDVTARLVVD